MHNVSSDVYTGCNCAAFKTLTHQHISSWRTIWYDQNYKCILLLTINSIFRNLLYTYVHNCAELFTEALFVRQDWKWPKCPSVVSRFNQLWPISYNGTLATAERDPEEDLSMYCYVQVCHNVYRMLPWVRKERQEGGKEAKNRQCFKR